jgi:hypothetical protein
MTWVLIALAIWLALLVCVWALCVAAGRADRAPAPGADARWAGVPGPPEQARPAEEHTIPSVADVAALQTRLEAAAVMLRAQRVALVAHGRAGARTLAGAGGDLSTEGAHELEVAVGSAATLVATRAAAQGAFTDADRRLLAAVAESVGDVVVPDRGAAASGRFAREQLPAGSRRAR